ncbi:hypothetical protein ACFVT5_40915 [Streptomyces sp. NPDC058001]|uniref:hypothetical protein n=1 Tax=Streptomyces sp. NPDC058001 TaxID=3346300 RepID=UPI0036ECE3DD
MTINHRDEAEKHLATAAHHLTEEPADMRIAEVAAWIGQGHAALTRNEEHAATTADLRDAITLLRRREYATREAVSAHIAKGLASRERNRWSAARSLAQALDEAEANMDDLIDARLSDGGWDPRSAWKAVASAVPADDPWTPTPDITAEVPERVRRVLVEYLAAALLSKGDAQGVGQTIIFALKRAGADLTGDIEKQITSITLGPDPSDPPF